MGDYADGKPYGGHQAHRLIVQADEGTGGIVSDTPKWGVPERITAYLASGGLFNPELANHEAVRDLMMDARDELAEAMQSCDVLNADANKWKARAENAEHELAEARAEIDRKLSPEIYRALRADLRVACESGVTFL